MFVVEADPHAAGELRSKAHEPRVGIVLGRAGLPGGGAAERFGLNAGAELNDLFQHGRHRPRNFGRDHVVDFGMRLFQQSAVVACHTANHVGIDANSIIRKYRKCRHVLE